MDLRQAEKSQTLARNWAHPFWIGLTEIATSETRIGSISVRACPVG